MSVETLILPGAQGDRVGAVGETTAVQLEPGDVDVAVEYVAGVSSTVPGPRWNDSEPGSWSPRRTLDHVVDTVLLYSAYIETRSHSRITPPRKGDPVATRRVVVAMASSVSS